MAALMISSQLLLTVFVVYWLTGQYREERTILHGQLKKEYVQVHDQLVDSMLMKQLIIPSLDDSMQIQMHGRNIKEAAVWIEADTVAIKMKHQGGELPEDLKIQTIQVEGPDPQDTGLSTLNITSVITDEERMVRSVKLFIHQNQQTFQSDTAMHVFAMNLDSSTVMLNMEHALEKNDWPFELKWTGEDQDKVELAHSHGILLYDNYNRLSPPLRVEHVAAYLVRAILPQMLFGLVLLLLSASAFLFTYRSLLRQLALNRLRDDFIGNISHELKTPVSTVKIALEALRSFDKQKDAKVSSEYLEMASKELERLENLVAKVLHHQMLDNPSLVLEKEDCHLGDLARSVVRTMDLHIREKGASVTVTEENGPCRVHGDRIYVEGMIMNLVDNSLKYAGKHPEIKLKVECLSSGTVLSVSDKGPGIPEEYKDQVFEKFFRLPTGNTHNVKGYGLGLNFASQVMARHGGTISYKNLPEGGCRFTLQFPGTEV
jgi:signal transduction histidine kinase